MNHLHRSAQMQVLDEIYEEAGFPEGQLLARFKQWSQQKSLESKTQRSLYRAISLGKSTKQLGLLAEFCSAPVDIGGLGVEISPDAFDVQGRVKDYLARFADKNDVHLRHLELAVGAFEVCRAGTVDIEKGRKPNWKDPKHQVFDLELWRPGDRTGFVFRYSDRDSEKDKINRSRWEGHALATADAIWLIGVEPHVGQDAVMFILQPLRPYDYDLLVGVQLAKLDDDSKEGCLRELGVGRRIAAFRLKSRRYTPVQLRRAAQRWVEQAPLGAVVEYRSQPLPTPRRG